MGGSNAGGQRDAKSLAPLPIDCLSAVRWDKRV